MQKFKIIILLLHIIVFYEANCQHIVVSGYVEDLNSGERIIGAYVIDTITNSMVQTNDYGFFNIKISDNKAAIMATYIGFRSDIISLQSGSDTLINIQMKPVLELNEVVISSSPYKHVVSSPPGYSVIPIYKLASIPSLGETDLLKSIQYQPGIKGGMEGSTGVFVRGGGPGENLFMLDDVPLYNVSHLYGFFSSFNTSSIKDIKLIKGCFPARYGGRVSSIIDVRSKDGNINSIKGEISAGIISSGVLLEGPLFSKKTTFIISGRRSYFDTYSEALKRMDILGDNFPGYYFYDLNARIAHTFSPKDKIFISFYTGKDRIMNKDEATFEKVDAEKYSETDKQTSGWGNMVGSIRWNHTSKYNIFINTTFALSSYNYFLLRDHKTLRTDTAMNNNEINYNAYYGSAISDIIMKADFSYSLNNNHKLFAGFGNTFHRINPGINKYRIYNRDYNENLDTIYLDIEKSYANDILSFSEPHIYFEDNIKIKNKLDINFGIRLSGIVLSGQSKFRVEPRISAVYTIAPPFALKAGFSRMTQYFHLLTTSGISSPSDLWIPALKGLEPLRSDQWNAGFSYDWADKLLISIEFYQKKLNYTTDYKNGASLLTDLIPWYEKTTQGNGKAKGMEISIEKQSGRFTGAFYYTFAKADRNYRDLNNGISFPFKYDRLHDLNTSLNIQFSKKVDVSVLWTFGTGYPVTIPYEKYFPALNLIDNIQFNMIYYYPSINNYRLQPYHRLDLGIHYKTQNKLGEHRLSLDLFNAYNHKNPVNMYFLQNYSFQQVYLLPFIPSLTYTLKFY